MGAKTFPGPKAMAYLERAKRVYATTTMFSRISPHLGDGAYITDFDGFKFIDFHCDAGVNNIGRNYDRVDRALRKQMKTKNRFSEFHNAPHPLGLDFAELLLERSPVMKPAKMFFSNSGAEANEAAHKLCLGYRYHRGETNRKKIIYFANGFAGRTAGVLSGTTSKPEVQRNPFWTHCDQENSIYLPYPREGDDWTELRSQFDALPHHEIDRLLIEIPCQGEGGMIPIDERALDFLYHRCRDEGIFIIADCVQAGMGRAGTLYGADCFPWFMPDILTMGKAAGGGLPIGITIFRADLDWEPKEHSNTFGGGPLVAAAGIAAFTEIDALVRSGAVERLAYWIKNWLFSFCEYGIVADVRGRGAMWGIEFKNADIMERIIRLGEEFTEYKGCGLRLLGAGDAAVRIMPPLNITRPVLNHGMGILKEIIEIVELETNRPTD